MRNVIMMCGVCGSGKTTYSKEKEKAGYIRLSIDEEMWRIYGRRGVDYPDDQYEALSEKVEWSLREKLLGFICEGKDVVLDFSFWTRENHSFYRQIIEKSGGTVELVYMKASLEILQKRLEKRNLHRNANSPFVITDEILRHHYDGFQEPCGEGKIMIPQDNESIMPCSDCGGG